MHIHAANASDESADADRLQALSERMSRSEPDLPSIHTPLAHESAITTELARTSIDTQHDDDLRQMAADRTATSPPTPREPARPAPALRGTFTSATAGDASARDHAPTQLRRDAEIPRKLEPAADRAAGELRDEHLGRRWPPGRHRDLATPELIDDQAEGGHRHGWAP
jgi:hypothetical protein